MRNPLKPVSTEVPAYADVVATLDANEVAAWFQGRFDTGINACIECCDRHAGAGRVALEWESEDGRRGSMTFEALQVETARFAGMLTENGIRAGDVVAGLLPRTPELLITILGTWRAGAVYLPLFTAFGPKAIEHRLHTCGAKLVVTDSRHRAKLDEVDMTTFAPVIVVSRHPDIRDRDASADIGGLDFHQALAAQPGRFAPVMRTGTDLFMVLCTSGTTGLPKAVPVPLKALAAFHAYTRYAVDLREDDRFWNLADPGWAYGLYYAVTGPLLLGHATTFYDGAFSAESTLRIIRSHRITNLTGSPTAFRFLTSADPEVVAALKGRLRAVSSAGEPLNPEVIRWFDVALGVPIHDHYGQTETGMLVNNHHGLRHPIHPGSAGLAMPGYRVAVLDENGRELGANVPGTLAVDIVRSPLLWFTGYLHQPTPAIDGGYYLTGDTVELEAEGHITFVGRNDDIITSSGYRIGPFDVESALLEHPSVLESAVIGKPDPERTEIVKAFIVLRAGIIPSDALAQELSLHVKRRLSAHAYPREIVFLDQLPKTPSGKIQRFVLRTMPSSVAAAGTSSAAPGLVAGIEKA